MEYIISFTHPRCHAAVSASNLRTAYVTARALSKEFEKANIIEKSDPFHVIALYENGEIIDENFSIKH